FSYLVPSHLYTLSLHDALPIFDERAGDDVARADELPDFRRGFRRDLPRRAEALLGEQLLDLVTLDHAGCRIGGELRDQHPGDARSEEHTSELQSRGHLVCRLLL